IDLQISVGMLYRSILYLSSIENKRVALDTYIGVHRQRLLVVFVKRLQLYAVYSPNDAAEEVSINFSFRYV
ncbi:hypothetical protein CSUI_003786, partial [Cystoisospora suis]